MDLTENKALEQARPRAGGRNRANGGFRRITRLAPPVEMRVLGFLLVVVVGTLLLSWMTATVWRQLERLKSEHAAVKSESFYLGVTLRSAIRSLNSSLLQYGLSPDLHVREGFEKEASVLRSLMQTNQAQLMQRSQLHQARFAGGVTRELELLRRVETAFEEYLKQTAAVFAPRPAPADLDTFEEIYQKVQSSSHKLLGLCDELVVVQRRSFAAFLAETQKTLTLHQQLLQVTFILMLTLAGTLAILVYRGMIAPLRRGLTESKTIIERQEKLASLGVLASGVAHEVRNPLTAIKFRLFSLKRAMPALGQNDDLGIIANELNRLERIVKDFLRFARPSEPELAPVEAEKLVRNVQALLKPQLDRLGISLSLESRDSAWLHADSQQIEQVLINLIQNAAEAIGRNGLITLSINAGALDLDGRARSAASITVHDNGKGMTPEVEARLFDPFFTTKERGTGLGLAVAARIVEKHGGVLRYETEPGQGTTFEILLPCVEYESSEPIADRG